MMKRSKFGPEWSTPHLLSFVTNSSGSYLAVHADLAGITLLIDELKILREQLEQDDCPHSHLFSPEVVGKVLTSTKIADQELVANVICHVKIYGWNNEWAVRHELKPETA